MPAGCMFKAHHVIRTSQMFQDGGANIIPTLQMRKLRLRCFVRNLRAGGASLLVSRMACWVTCLVPDRDMTPASIPNISILTGRGLCHVPQMGSRHRYFVRGQSLCLAGFHPCSSLELAQHTHPCTPSFQAWPGAGGTRTSLPDSHCPEQPTLSDCI